MRKASDALEGKKYAARFAPLFRRALRRLRSKKRLSQVEIQYVYIGLTNELMELKKAQVAKQQIIDGLLKELNRLERRIAV